MISDERERHPAQSLPGSRPTARVRDGELRGDSAVEQHRVLRAERAHDARDLGNGEPKWNAVRAGNGNDVHRLVDDERLAFVAAEYAGREGPDRLQVGRVRRRDLIEAAVACGRVVARGHRPLAVVALRAALYQ